MFPNRVPMDTFLSPEAVVYSLIHIHQWSLPAKRAKHLFTVHGTPWGQKAYIQLGVAWFPNRIVYNTAISTPVPCSLQHGNFHLDLGPAIQHVL